MKCSLLGNEMEKETFPSMQRPQQLQKIGLHPYFKAFWGRRWKVISHSRKQMQEVRDTTDGYRHKTSQLDYGMELKASS